MCLWDRLCDVFYAASNMKENLSKRELLPIGSLKNIDPLTLPGTIWDVKLQKNINPCVVTPGNWLRSLGYPIGNEFTPDDFLKTIYKCMRHHGRREVVEVGGGRGGRR